MTIQDVKNKIQEACENIGYLNDSIGEYEAKIRYYHDEIEKAEAEVQYWEEIEREYEEYLNSVNNEKINNK